MRRRRRAALTLGLGFAIAVSATGAVPVVDDSRYGSAQRFIVLICPCPLADGSCDKDKAGSGFIIGHTETSIYVASAQHVSQAGDPGNSCFLAVRFRQTETYTPAAVVYQDADHEFAIIEIDRAQITDPVARSELTEVVVPTPQMPLRPEIDHVFFTGYGKGVEWHKSPFYRVISHDDQKIEVDAPGVPSGYSGGPMLNECYQVAAMSSLSDWGAAPAMRIEWIREKVGDWGHGIKDFVIQLKDQAPCDSLRPDKPKPVSSLNGFNTVTIEWPPLPNAKRFHVERSLIDGDPSSAKGWWLSIDCSSAPCLAKDTSAVPGSTYNYYVTAIDAQARGTVSNPVTVKTFPDLVPEVRERAKVQDGDQGPIYVVDRENVDVHVGVTPDDELLEVRVHDQPVRAGRAKIQIRAGLGKFSVKAYVDGFRDPVNSTAVWILYVPPADWEIELVDEWTRVAVGRRARIEGRLPFPSVVSRLRVDGAAVEFSTEDGSFSADVPIDLPGTSEHQIVAEDHLGQSVSRTLRIHKTWSAAPRPVYGATADLDPLEVCLGSGTQAACLPGAFSCPTPGGQRFGGALEGVVADGDGGRCATYSLSGDPRQGRGASTEISISEVRPNGSAGAVTTQRLFFRRGLTQVHFRDVPLRHGQVAGWPGGDLVWAAEMKPDKHRKLEFFGLNERGAYKRVYGDTVILHARHGPGGKWKSFGPVSIDDWQDWKLVALPGSGREAFIIYVSNHQSQVKYARLLMNGTYQERLMLRGTRLTAHPVALSSGTVTLAGQFDSILSSGSAASGGRACGRDGTGCSYLAQFEFRDNRLSSTWSRRVAQGLDVRHFVDALGGFLVAGTAGSDDGAVFFSDLQDEWSFSPHPGSALLALYSRQGDFLWATVAPGSGEPLGVAATPDGGLVLAGRPSQSSDQVRWIRYDPPAASNAGLDE